jgi:uncharacterized protein YcbX
LSRILLYPLKSFDGVDVPQASLLPAGPLENDRRWKLVDAQGKTVNGKRSAKVHHVRTLIDLDARVIDVWDEQIRASRSFHLDGDQAELQEWLSRALDLPVELTEDPWNGFPDDLESPGPTLVSLATLQEVASWFRLDVEETIRRFRPNLIIEDAPAFWEDQLFGPAGTTIPFQIGDVQLEGINPCQRCAVPTRDSRTGDVRPEFAKIFQEKREQNLPEWAEASRFTHFYRLTVNTRVPMGASRRLQVGDQVTISGASS